MASKIYVGKFNDASISEDQILEYFKPYGQVMKIERPVDRSKNSEPKNFCFITFDKEESANQMIQKGTLNIEGQEVFARGKYFSKKTKLFHCFGSVFVHFWANFWSEREKST